MKGGRKGRNVPEVKQELTEVNEDVNNDIQHHKKRAFLAAYCTTGNVTRAAIISEIDRGTHYRWLKEDEDYAKAFAYADEEAGDYLEEEARRRAVEGVEEPVFHQGQVVGAVRKYSDTLLIYLLNGSKPEKYKQRTANEHSGKMSLDVDIERMDDSELLASIEATTQAITDLQKRIVPPA